ncbi:MAG TPA: chemotaxis protein CheB [Verrucomicrobiae bacterium]|nr:chemotaxis protein CheB [Verrucomicrobiae bacterium]
MPIVGIGASAGGLEAMTKLLRALPDDTGMSFVLVQHLDPTHKSQLTSLLSRGTLMPLSEARNNVALEPNHLYVIPPDRMMVIRDRTLKLLPRKGAKELHTPIDYFLRSLAEEEGSSAIGVILSGNGSDGTLGLQAIKAAGGLTFAQDELSAKFPSMPGNAVAARCVDFVLSPEKLGRELSRLASHPYVAPLEVAKHLRTAPTEGKAFDDILSTLRQRTGVDFTGYKHATLDRRIHRRMALHRHEKLRDYAQYVHSHAAEAKELFNDILIHVTSFFRDRSVFATLKRKILPRLLKTKRDSEPLRIWVPGCSSGEEVYSIAITLIELLSDQHSQTPIQIFGTDINKRALERARSGIYPECIHEDVSAERLRRFFVRHEGGYRVNKSIRELCIFAQQNVVVDPPFSNLDLISCRNVLIYLDQPLQRKIMPIFHYALKSTGLLLLGVSETIGNFPDLFALTDKKAKIYSKKAAHIRHTINFPPFVHEARTAEPREAPESAPTLADIQRHADRLILAHYSPAGVVINSAMEVLQFRGRTGEFFEHPQGEASFDLIKMAREGLAVDLRAAVSKSMKQSARICHEGARIKQNGGYIDVTVEVVPFQISPSRERFYLVLLDFPRQPRHEKDRKAQERRRLKRPEVELNHLRDELATTRESLQAIIEEQEATNEELRSANEEIMSSNEELQSTNEELETAKEELQSTNEELTTLNEELETRNVEMTHVNNDLENVMVSVNIPMLILGRDLRIRRFTAGAEKVFNLIPGDIGRPITDIALKVDVPNLVNVVAEVISSLSTKEIEVQGKNNRYWSVRVRPYKTTDNKIDGAVIAMMDIHDTRSGALAGESAKALADAIINIVREPLLVLDENLLIRHLNNSFLTSFKVRAQEALQRKIYDLKGPQWKSPKLRRLLEVTLPKNTEPRDVEIHSDHEAGDGQKILFTARRLKFQEDGQQSILLAIHDGSGTTTK